MKTNYEFYEGQAVSFNYSGVLKGEGIVRGCCLVDLPVLGKHYIVEVTCGDYDRGVYPFSCISVPAISMQTI